MYQHIFKDFEGTVLIAFNYEFKGGVWIDFMDFKMCVYIIQWGGKLFKKNQDDIEI